MTHIFTYNIQDQMKTAGEISFDYNPDGYMTTKTASEGTTGYEYSSLGELTKVTLPGNKTIAYKYDPYGRRIERSVNGAVTDRYLWTGQTTLLAVFDSENNLKYRFEYADNRMSLGVIKFTKSGRQEVYHSD